MEFTLSDISSPQSQRWIFLCRAMLNYWQWRDSKYHGLKAYVEQVDQWHDKLEDSERNVIYMHARYHTVYARYHTVYARYHTVYSRYHTVYAQYHNGITKYINDMIHRMCGMIHCMYGIIHDIYRMIHCIYDTPRYRL
eukprot:GHVO01018570.1.p1 GENE.GHVO01018570.1~~GHVO01018570.1.p1  ORF type:complete len:138 (-),score=11.77 GHVO01018570.1:371-784(-)